MLMKSNVISLLSLFMMLFATSLSAQNSITGVCMDKSDKALPGVSVTLYAKSDTTKMAAGVASDAAGRFTISGVKPGDYVLTFSMLGFNRKSETLNVNGDKDIGNVILTENDVRLDNVVVTSRMLRSYGNRDDILLTELARKTGNNALDAIGSMPQFRKSMSGTTLTTADNKSILILINGRKSDGRDLMQLQAGDVSKLTFYSDPPARYAGEGYGSVLDVVTKKRKDRIYSMYLDTKNAFTTGYGENNLSLYYADSLNMLSAYYYINYRDMGDNKMNSRYEYPDGSSSIYDGLSGEFNFIYNAWQAMYQREQGKNLFNVRLRYEKYPASNEYTQKLSSTDNGITTSGMNLRKLESNYDALTLDLYYTRKLNKDRSMTFNVVNTFYNSSSDNRLELDSETDGYTTLNKVKNKSYSLIGEIYYTDKLWNGTFNSGVYYQYKNLRQTYNETERYSPRTHREYVYADYTNSFGKLSYTVGLGLDNIQYKTAENKNYNFTSVRPQLSMNLPLTKQAGLRLNASVRTDIPEMGDLTNSVVSIDRHLFSRGNTELRPCYYYDTSLKFQYSSADNKLYLSAMPFFTHYADINMPVFLFEGSDVYLTKYRLNKMNEVGFSSSLTYYPVKWLSVSPYYNFSHKSYDTPNLNVEYDRHNTGIGARLYLGNFQVEGAVNFPYNSIDGDIKTRNGYRTYGAVSWRNKHISVGLEYRYAMRESREHAELPSFKYGSGIVWYNSRNMFDVTFTCYLWKGKARRHADKQIFNSDNDSGLTEQNKAK